MGSITQNKIHHGKKNTKKRDIRISKADYEFNVYDRVWELDVNYKINFDLLDDIGLSYNFKNNFKLVLADYASEFSSSYVLNIFYYCRKLFSFGVYDILNEKHIINYKATLSREFEYKLGCIRAFILDWKEKEIKGIDDKAVLLLNTLNLSGNKKGKAVALGCAYSGAYTFEEQAAFIDWYVNAYTDNIITLSDYAIIMILQQTGVRPIQVSQIFVGDIIIRSELGTDHYDLKIPKGKNRKKMRDEFQIKQEVNEDLMLVLKAQAKKTVERIETQFKIDLDDEQIKNIPLFVDEKKIIKLTGFDQFKKLQQNNLDFFCIRVINLSHKIRRMARLCPLKTNRILMDNGEYGDLHINPRRFRYTHATNLAMLGAGKNVIALELGHSDTQNVDVYTEFNEDIADRINEALESDLIPLSQAFSGTLIDSEKDAIRANDPRSRVNSGNGNAVGNCGEFGFCANGVIHCYPCIKFQPWLNANHQEVLSAVEAERDRRKKMGASEFVLQGHNRTINAIKVVIQRCHERKLELQNEGVLDV